MMAAFHDPALSRKVPGLDDDQPGASVHILPILAQEDGLKLLTVDRRLIDHPLAITI